MPLSPGAILPRDMDARQWARFASESGIQADRSVKSFTPTWGAAGFSVDPVGDISYYDFGRLVVLWVTAALTGTSDDTLMSITNLPESLRPSDPTIRRIPCLVVDLNGTYHGEALVSTTGTITFGMAGVSGARIVAGTPFTASSVKGLPDGWLIMYAKWSI